MANNTFTIETAIPLVNSKKKYIGTGLLIDPNIISAGRKVVEEAAELL
jgi:hypothetical protein